MGRTRRNRPRFDGGVLRGRGGRYLDEEFLSEEEERIKRRRESKSSRRSREREKTKKKKRTRNRNRNPVFMVVKK